jgi:hypothetical protein
MAKWETDLKHERFRQLTQGKQMPSCYYLSAHAQKQMRERNFTKDEIDRAFWCGQKVKNGTTTEYILNDLCVIIRDFTIITLLVVY